MQSVRNQAGLAIWGKIYFGRVHGAVAAALVLLSGLLPIALASAPKLCLFNHIAGIPCPFCGLTRSFLEIAHFSLIEAAKYHVLGIPLFATFLALPVFLIVRPQIVIPISKPIALIVASIVMFAWAVKLFVVSPDYW